MRMPQPHLYYINTGVEAAKTYHIKYKQYHNRAVKVKNTAPHTGLLITRAIPIGRCLRR